MTDSQLNLIKRLCNEREVPADNLQLMSDVMEGRKILSTRRASDCIGWLLRLPLLPRESQGGEIDPNLVPGVYEVNGEIFVVKKNREKTRLYAKRLVERGNGVVRATESGERVRGFDFKWAPGAVYRIKLSDRMPVERAKELIVLYGRCIACGIALTAAKSVEQGIGPVCIKKFGPVLNPVAQTADGRAVEVKAA